MADMRRTIREELENWQGVDWEFTVGGKHHRVVTQFGGNRRFVTYTTTRTDPRGTLNKLRDIRQVCRELGATRHG